MNEQKLETKIDLAQTVHRIINWVILAFVGVLIYLAEEVRTDVRELKKISADERVIDATHELKLQAHEQRIAHIERITQR